MRYRSTSVSQVSRSVPLVSVLVTDLRNMPLPGQLFHSRYREKFRFGAMTLRLGMGSDEMRSCLTGIVADAACEVTSD
ncbi:MAG: hypothetical protein FWD67_12405 [Betaproteobacteria bacterium]|nr:hypothetical protein [Betaproteobacteria bacterium]